MTNQEKLTKIRAKCVELSKLYGDEAPIARAGMMSTIAAIDRLENPASWWSPHSGGHEAEFAAYLAINQILSAWPDELLD